ncbi:MAG: hybrid sensor histidine kinase/response regulator [Coriobacteriia bacterium]|nr:hybrid sensor histidine kinase/response regulator [Coriobacteriia bacterium]
MVEFDRSAFITKFQEEAGELLQRLNEGVISLEGDSKNRELIDQMLRDAHTLKGSSRMVGLIDISDVAHRLEDIMVGVRDGHIEYTPDMSDNFFEALDVIVYLSENAGKDVDESGIDLEAVQAKLSAIAEARDERETGPAEEPAESEIAPPASSTGGAAGDESDYIEIQEEHVEAPAAAASASGVAAPKDESLRPKIQHTIRIRTGQIDHLLNLISEVVISQIKAEQRIVELRGSVSEMSEIWVAWSQLKSTLNSLSAEEETLLTQVMDDASRLDGLLSDRRRALASFAKLYMDDTSRTSVVLNDLQEQGMRLRMLPVSTVFNTFPRAMRDLARSFKKDVELIIEGGDTELDKKVLEEINDPLIHIMRNAVDHGIESREVRKQAGKPEQGTIRMIARQEGDHIVIEVSDDGAGIDPAKVRTAAIRKGYISEAESKAMSEREATYLIFEKGFSTSAIITEISGRGVGMDVVREYIVEKLKGSLDVWSELGAGSTFRLTIPLTLAIIRALMLRVGDQVFALPTASVEETLRIQPEEIIKVEGREVIRRQRRTVPLVRLGDILSVPAHGHEGAKIPIATIGFSGHRMGFIVDQLVGEQQIVIKTLGSHLQKIENVAGVTVLGAGEVVPILNVPDLMENARYRAGQTVTAVEAEERTGPRQILICEDSFTTRELERSIFEAAGYDVEVAVDGAQGYSKLKEGMSVDAVITDVQMPNMTGFELTRAIRSDSNLSHIPVVIVTSLERDEEKTEGIDAGADAYITKSVFNQDTLLDTVERLIR